MEGLYKANTIIKKVLFACVLNSGRRQIAEALLNHYISGKDQAFTAGIHPASQIHPTTVETLKELDMESTLIPQGKGAKRDSYGY